MIDPGTQTDHTHENGFTLIELLVALTLVAMVFGLLATSLHLFTRGWNTRISETSERDMISRALSLVARDIEGTQRIVHQTEDGPSFFFQGRQDALTLIALEPPYPTQSGLFLITYRVRSERTGAVLLRQRRRYHPEIDINARMSGSKAVPLIEGPFAIRFSYLDTQAGNRVWHTAWPDTTRLPIAISLEVVNRGQARLAFAPLVAKLHLDAEISCIDERPKQCTATTDGALAPSATQQETEGRGEP